MNDDILKEIVKIDFAETEYYKDIYTKRQIVLHHTVSNGSAQAVAAWWSSKPSHVGTAIVIDKEGVIHQLFGSQYYAGHVGSTTKETNSLGLPARNCSKNSIGVELVNGGGLTMSRTGKLYDAYGHEFKNENITNYPNGYRGYNYFPEYTKTQITSLKKLLLYWSDRYDIPTTYNKDIWDVNAFALTGVSGIYPHTSFRAGKSDLHPQLELIEMLKSL